MRKSILVLALPLLLPVAAPAHHSFAMFDASVKETISGVITEVQWTNPHIWIHVNVTGEDGKVAEWAVEGGSPNMLVRQGYTSKTLKPGERVSVTLNPLKSGEPGGSLISIQLPDGTTLGSGGGAITARP